MQLRDYQQSAIDALYNYLRTKTGNPCIVAPTGSGKSPIISTICRDAVTRWNGRVLVLAHVKELLEQTANTLRRIDPNLQVGIYSAGLKSRDTTSPIIVAGIQSVYKRACELDRFDLILMDECHLLPPDGEGMYRTFLNEAKIVNPKLRLIGLTATPFRLKSGMLCGPDNLLNDVCYEIGIKELIENGYLSPLHSRSSRYKVDCSSLHVRGGEFIASEVDALVDTENNVQDACREIVSLTQNRHSVLIFAVSVKHAEHVKRNIEKITSLECGIVTGDTPASERDTILRRFKGEVFPKDLLGGITEPLKFLVNVNVLTTGFDAPNIDCVVLLRPTASAGLYAQMVGRAMRLHETKTDAMILDYGGNILRHGPVDAITVKEKKTKGTSDAPVKECPKCYAIVHAAVGHCPDCGYEFPKPDESDKHDANAANEGILSGEIIDTDYEVQDVFYTVHTKRGEPDAPKTIKIEYKTGYNDYIAEWVCPEHSGWARKKYETWWDQRSSDPPPESAALAVKYAQAGSVAAPTHITVRKIAGEKFPRIVKYTLAPKPEPIGEFADEKDYYTCGECSWYACTVCGRFNKDAELDDKACDSFAANLDVVPF
ncbi:MAG: DEAD/DEAH box helicase family protein [Thermoguttaceae bacterium]